MSDDQERMRDVFDRARRVIPSERSRILDDELGRSGWMRQHVELMLEALDQAGAFLSQPTQAHPDAAAVGAGAAATAMAEPPVEGPGSRIGPFKLLQLIGQGGFGSVFLAEQESPVVRKVALKIIKLGMDTRQVVARFEQERQALAIMDHPNIAKVLDAGATASGRPYFVMELVKGDPIVEYCDRNGLDIPERLELFGQVCAAVQHAHQKGIIHRDLKPSNILVCTQDGRPHAKVIDFGIAKATASKLTEKTLFTEHRQLIGTPEYMSPEQAEGSLDIDTRTDVYSLGVLLYELLTGSTPFSGRALRAAAFAELQRIIREEEPLRPSTRLERDTELRAKVAAQRHTEPARLGAMLRGELDWIVMKALEKDRQRRYASPGELSADVRRFLDGDAVVAAPPSAAYRLRKLILRHRGLVAAGAAVATALLLGAFASAWQAHLARASEANAVALAQRSRAVSTFLRRILESADPARQGAQVTLVDVLKGSEPMIRDELDGQPDVEREVRETIGGVLFKLQVYRDAEPHFRRALELALLEDMPAIQRQGLDARMSWNARWVTPLVKTRSLMGLGPDVPLVFMEMAEQLARTAGPTHPATVWLQEAAGRLAPLTSAREPAVVGPAPVSAGKGRSRAASGPVAPASAIKQAMAESRRLAPAQREERLRAAIREVREASGGDTQETVDALVLLSYGQRGEAQLATLREALGAAERTFGPAHQTTTTVCVQLATLLSVSDPDEAERLLRGNLAALLQAGGPASGFVAMTSANLGRILALRGRHAEAVELLRRAVGQPVLEATLLEHGTAESWDLFPRAILARCLMELGRCEEAEETLLWLLRSNGAGTAVNAAFQERATAQLVQLYDRCEAAHPGTGFAEKAAELRRKGIGAANTPAPPANHPAARMEGAPSNP